MKGSGVLAVTVAIVGLAACSSMEIGGGSSPVTGSAGATGDAKGAAASLVKCQEPVGTIALVESQIPALAQAGLTSPVPLIRLIAAQSRCFNVVERGQALTRMMDERNLAAGNMLQPGANIGQGQMVAADYMVTPNVVFSQSDAGGAGAALGAGRFIPYVGPAFGVAGAVAGSVQFKEAQAVMMVTDVRSGVQVAVAEGRAKASDLGGGFGLGGLYGFGSLGGYSNTDQGKVVAGAFLDAFNKLVEQVRGMRASMAPAPAAAATAKVVPASTVSSSAPTTPPPSATQVAIAPTPAPGSQAPLRTLEVTLASANVRDGAGVGFKVVTRVTQGAKVAFIEEGGTAKDRWYKVKLASGQEGWIAASAVIESR